VHRLALEFPEQIDCAGARTVIHPFALCEAMPAAVLEIELVALGGRGFSAHALCWLICRLLGAQAGDGQLNQTWPTCETVGVLGSTVNLPLTKVWLFTLSQSRLRARWVGGKMHRW
jgi:hypothetical protein